MSGPGVVHQLGNIQTIGVGGKPLAQLVVFGKRNNLPRGRQAKLLDIIFFNFKTQNQQAAQLLPLKRFAAVGIGAAVGQGAVRALRELAPLR